MSDPAAVPALRPERMIVSSEIPVLDTGMFDHMTRIAKVMAASSLVPAHLNKIKKVGGQDVEIDEKEGISNCFLVVNQAARWRMDPFAVAQHVFVTNGKIGYEGKLIAGVINTHPSLETRLSYKYEGSGEERKITVTAKLKGDSEARSIEGKVKDWKTTRSGSPWASVSQHDQMLAYRGAREWARRHMPEAVLGVWGDDELEIFEAGRTTAAAADERSGAARLASAVSRATDAELVLKFAVNVKAGDDLYKLVGTWETIPPAIGAEWLDQDGVVYLVKKVDATEPPVIIVEPKVSGAAAPAATEAPKPAAAEQKAPVQPGPPPKAGDQAGAEVKRKYLDAFAASSDADVLDLKYDETRFLKWSVEDARELDEAYKAQRAKLGK